MNQSIFRTAVLVGASTLLFAGCGGGKSASTTAANTAATTAASGAVTSASTAPGGAVTGSGSMKSRSMLPMALVPATLKCGAVKPVWVNTRTKVYREPSNKWYGRTKRGKYMCASAAKKMGYRLVKKHMVKKASGKP